MTFSVLVNQQTLPIQLKCLILEPLNDILLAGQISLSPTNCEWLISRWRARVFFRTNCCHLLSRRNCMFC